MEGTGEPFLFIFFKGPYLWHMEVPGLGAAATATAMPDPSHICSLPNGQIFNPLSEARD